MQHRQFSSRDGELVQVWDETCVFLPQKEIQAAADHLAACKAMSAASSSHRHSRLVPDGAIDGCQESHKAAGARQSGEANEGIYRSKGLMGLVCRHDIPLLLCDIRSAGEGQKYPIALIVALSSQLPPNAMIGLLYDIGCVLDRSIAKVSLEASVVGNRSKQSD